MRTLHFAETFHRDYQPTLDILPAADVADVDIQHLWTVVSEDNPTTWMNELIALAGRRSDHPRVVGYVVTRQPWSVPEERGVYFDPAHPHSD